MTFAAVCICVLCQICLVGGHLALKHAVNATHAVPVRWMPVAVTFAGAICLLAMWFFLWLGLLRDWELSRIYPFDGLGPPLLVVGAWIFLKEKVSARTWLGIVLIGVGVALVAEG